MSGPTYWCLMSEVPPEALVEYMGFNKRGALASPSSFTLHSHTVQVGSPSLRLPEGHGGRLGGDMGAEK